MLLPNFDEMANATQIITKNIKLFPNVAHNNDSFQISGKFDQLNNQISYMIQIINQLTQKVNELNQKVTDHHQIIHEVNQKVNEVNQKVINNQVEIVKLNQKQDNLIVQVNALQVNLEALPEALAIKYKS
ncbi:hypothetical protein O181_055117 [Austropuccinia psidii MF-1]|uniref:Uncharacterized protein n=1 Tax=Austropuccinia psidii MF-1 TaxID=1389203 RepID=A0A9Q3ED05_9BASI|nr:hypothetical protein [Austropuccinia psidii MF-1]